MSYLFNAIIIVVLLIMLGLFVFTWLISKRVEAGMPPEGNFITIQGTRVHYLEQGQGPAMVMIHGLSGVAQNFGYQVLGDLAKTHRVIAIDRPGSGYSVRHPRSAATLNVQADIVAGLIDALGLDKPLLVGHSLGGAISLATALRYPGKVSGLALIAPLTHKPKETSKAFAALNIPYLWLRKLVGWTVAIPLSIRNRDKVTELVFGPEAVPKDFPTRGGGFLGMRPSQFVAASSDAYALNAALPAMQQCYGAIALPVGVLYGRQDRILDPQEQGQALADALPGTELELVDGGHMLPITQPDLTSEFIRRQSLRSAVAE